MAHCASGRTCVSWFLLYLKDCVCGVRDYVSLSLGLIGVFCWAVAEIPQIFTNFKCGSADGVSLAYLLTWVVADLFNLFGCLLEPVTLPTQFYTALLYTITTEVLVCQSLYYGYICKCWNARKAKSSQTNNCARSDQLENTKTQPVNVPKSIDNSTELDNNKDGYLKKFPKGTAASSLPIRTISPARERSIGRNLYYISGRSFPGSHTSLPVSYLAASSHGSGLSGRGFTLNQSTVGDEGLLANLVPRNPKVSRFSFSFRAVYVAATVFFVGGLNYFQLDAGNVSLTSTFSKAETASVVVTGRKILQELSAIALRDSMIGENSTSPVGTCLGWLMAAIYMGGLLPQICLNVQRGTVEGLNPLMFMFALIGHAAYVGSILVRTLDWQKLKPNIPWLVDSIVCVLLDLIILAQFLYYKMKKPDDREDNSGDYQAVKP